MLSSAQTPNANGPFISVIKLPSLCVLIQRWASCESFRGYTCIRSIPARTFLSGSVEAANEPQIHTAESFSWSNEPLRAEIHRGGCFIRFLLQFAISIGQWSLFSLMQFCFNTFFHVLIGIHTSSVTTWFSFFLKEIFSSSKGKELLGFHIYQRPTKFKFKIQYSPPSSLSFSSTYNYKVTEFFT